MLPWPFVVDPRRNKQKRRNTSYTKSRCKFLLFLGINLKNIYFTIKILSQLFKNRRYHLAWCAPISIKINYTRLLAFKFPLFVFS